VRRIFAALNLASGRPFYRFGDRNAGREFLDFSQIAPPPLPRRTAIPEL
jgi:hypothetical protein